jgi:threonine dehydrogenase-like Zn-dependent dehydrogenase
MRGLLTHGKGDLALIDVEKPTIRNGMVLLRVSYASICGTDFSIIDGEAPPWASYPVILGHEFCGVVEEIGEDVAGVGLGDNVVVDNYLTCNACIYCKKGEYFFCDHRREPGFTIDGGFADYCLLPHTSLVRIPDGLSLKSAVITEPAANCLKACKMGGIGIGERILILGCGPMAAMSGMICKAMGARVIVLGRGERFGCFDSMGFDLLIDTDKENWINIIAEKYGSYHKYWGWKAIDAVIDTTQSGDLVYDSIRLLRPKGRAILLGLKMGQSISIPRDDVVLKDIRIIGSTSGMGYFYDTLGLIHDGHVDAGKIITHTFPLEEGVSAFDFLKRRAEGALKVVISMAQAT